MLLAGYAPGRAQIAVPGKLDFLKAQDSSFALLANTSATFQPGKHYPNEVFLITGLPFAPAISARVDLGVGIRTAQSANRAAACAISPSRRTVTRRW